jgi:hypothetical protein
MYLSRGLQQQLHIEYYKISRQHCHYKCFKKLKDANLKLPTTLHYTTKIAMYKIVFAKKL